MSQQLEGIIMQTEKLMESVPLKTGKKRFRKYPSGTFPHCAEVVGKARERLGVSIKVAAMGVGICPNYWCGFEKGRCKVPVKLSGKIARALGLSHDDVVEAIALDTAHQVRRVAKELGNVG